MKKIILCFTILIASLTLMACEDIRLGNDKEDNLSETLSNEVKLVSMESVDLVKSMRFTASFDVANEEDTDLELDTDVEETINYQYKIVNHNQETIDIKINLENEKNYYIFDFNMTSNNDETEILVDNEYAKLNDLDTIRWNGATNHSFTITIKLNSLLDTELTINNIYFSDRETGENKYSVDLNNMNEFIIFNVVPLEIEFVKVNANNKFEFSVSKDERVELNVELDNGKLLLDNMSETITYTYNLGDIVVEETLLVSTHYYSFFEISQTRTYSTHHLFIENISFEEITDFEMDLYLRDDTFVETINGLQETYELDYSLYGASKDDKVFKVVIKVNGFEFNWVI